MDSSEAKPPWKLATIAYEFLDLVRSLHVSFLHIDCSVNSEADCLSKEGVSGPNLCL